MARMALTPREYARADVMASLKIGLPGRPHGLLLCEDEDGRRWTVATEDTAYWQMIRDASPKSRVVGPWVVLQEQRTREDDPSNRSSAAIAPTDTPAMIT